MDDKRVNIRYNVYMNPISCSKADCTRTKVEISDISSEGLGITTDRRFTRGDRIELEMLVPGDDIPMFVKGEIAWIVKDKSSVEKYRAGVRINNIHKSDKNRIIKYLHSHFQ